MKAKLDLISKDKKIIGNNDKLPLLLTFPYIRITKEMESILRNHVVKRGSAINVDQREEKLKNKGPKRLDMKLLSKKK